MNIYLVIDISSYSQGICSVCTFLFMMACPPQSPPRVHSPSVVVHIVIIINIIVATTKVIYSARSHRTSAPLTAFNYTSILYDY